MSKAYPQAHCEICRNKGAQFCPSNTRHLASKPEDELRGKICKIFNVFPEELEFNLPGGIGTKKVEELESLIEAECTKRYDKGYAEGWNSRNVQATDDAQRRI